MAILESVKDLATKLGADTNGRTIADQINIINRHLEANTASDIAGAVKEYSKKAGAGGGGGGETFEVETTLDYTNSTYTCNKTYAEIDAAYEAGKNVTCTVTWVESGETKTTLYSYGVTKQEFSLSESVTLHFITFALTEIIYGQGPGFPTLAFYDDYDGEPGAFIARGMDLSQISPV